MHLRIRHRADYGGNCHPFARRSRDGSARITLRHEPFPDGEALGELGWALPRPLREPGQAHGKKAVIAVAHAMVVSVYYMLSRQQAYQELGFDYFDHRHADRKLAGARSRHSNARVAR
jgi:hypothetical protein